jgi:hypothetical protein
MPPPASTEDQMADRDNPKSRRGSEPPPEESDFAAQLARAEFGRHYVDPRRVQQTLKDGEIVFVQRPAKGRFRKD